MTVAMRICTSLGVLALTAGVVLANPTGAIAKTNAPATSSPSVVAASVGAESTSDTAKITADLESQYTNTQVTHGTTATVVTFEDHYGQTYRYEFSRAQLPSGMVRPKYDTTWTGFDLNRAETYQLISDGANAAIIYAIGAALGCTACAVGAAIEMNWSGRASAAYSNGRCLHINYWFTTSEYSGGYCR